MQEVGSCVHLQVDRKGGEGIPFVAAIAVGGVGNRKAALEEAEQRLVLKITLILRYKNSGSRSHPFGGWVDVAGTGHDAGYPVAMGANIRQ
jgi:hypothetical protein